MALQVKRESATPNLIKYSVAADDSGGEVTLSRDDLLRDSVRGPLRDYIHRGVRLDADSACRYLLCSPSMRPLVTPRSFARVAVDASTDSTAAVAFKIMAEPGAVAIVALEFRHTLAA